MKKYNIIFILMLWAVFLFAQAPPWAVAPEDYANNMTMVTQIHLDGNEVNNGNNILVAVVGEDIRGIANPIDVLGQHFYYLTVFSNKSSGEELSFRVWLEDENAVYPAIEKVDFVKNENMGGYPDGFDLNLSLDGDFPISLLAMPDDTTLATYAFEKIAVADFLVSQDNDPVDWSVVNGAHVTGVVSNDTLTVLANDPNWTGLDSVEVTATESGTSNAYAASQFVRFTVDPNYSSPVFSVIPDQLFENGEPAPSGNLSDYLTYTGPCLDYGFQVVLPTGSEPTPSWSQPNGNPGSMTFVAQAKYGGQSFGGSANLLAGFVNGQLVGVAQQQLLYGKAVFYLSLANIESGDITFKFYDADNQQLYEVNSGTAFVPNAFLGNFNNPFQLDFAPFSLELLATGEWSSSLLNPDWSGSLEVVFSVEDCSYADKNDDVTVIFTTDNVDPCSIPNITWTGNGDGTNWSDAANWSNGFVPQGCHHILIPNGMSVIVEAGYSAMGKTLEVTIGADLEVELTGVLDVKF